MIAIDVDPKKLDLAKHNAAIYGVADKIDFVKGDFFDLAHNLKVFYFQLFSNCFWLDVAIKTFVLSPLCRQALYSYRLPGEALIMLKRACMT